MGICRLESRRFTIIILLITGIIVIMDRAIIVNISNAPLKKQDNTEPQVIKAGG
jgi:predicted thioredoxin/glutaredoxin